VAHCQAILAMGRLLFSRMLKKSASFAHASIRGSTYGTEYGFASSIAAVSLDGYFLSILHGCLMSSHTSRLANGFWAKEYFRSLLESNPARGPCLDGRG
jgi:hypothetical protein